MAIVLSAQRVGAKRPRSFINRKSAPNTACAAVAPRHTSTPGLIRASSASSHGRQAVSSLMPGVWWIRRLPFSTNLKCFTAFVT